MRALRQIFLVALTAAAAIWAGRALRDAVDQANPPTSAPAAITPAPAATTPAPPPGVAPTATS